MTRQERIDEWIRCGTARRWRRRSPRSAAAGGACASAAAVSTQQEVQLGAQSAAEINRQLPIVQNANIHSYINQLGNSIAQRADPRGIRYTFYVVNSNEVNAFAIPGGYVYINRGLIERAEQHVGGGRRARRTRSGTWWSGTGSSRWRGSRTPRSA